MASNVSDFKLASTAAGFTLGFGVLCVWNAIQQTRAVRSPLRSVYIFMVWGEIVANLCIGIIGWLFLDGVLSPRQVLLRCANLPRLGAHQVTVFHFSSAFYSFGYSKFSCLCKSSSTESLLSWMIVNLSRGSR
jgi:hypothetical protein